MAKTFHIMSTGQKWERLEKEYIPSDWTSNAEILMTDSQDTPPGGRHLCARSNNMVYVTLNKFRSNHCTMLDDVAR